MDGSGQGPHALDCRDRRLGGEQGTNGRKQSPGTDAGHGKGLKAGDLGSDAGGALQERLGGRGGGGGGGGN